MASFDFVDAAAKAYEFTWRERSYIVRIAIPVVFVKLTCVLMIYVLGLQDKFLINGLIAIPGHIVEAVFIIGIIRYALYRETIYIWGPKSQPPQSNQKPLLYSDPTKRGRNIQASFAMYLLIKVIQLAMIGILMDYSQIIDHSVQEDPPPPTLVGAVIILSMLWLIIWSFRLIWLHIPVTMGYSFTKFLNKIQGFNSSLSMFAAWFICYLPIIILFAGFANVINIFVADGSILQLFAHETLKAIGELVLTILPTIAITYGILEMLSQKKNRQVKIKNYENLYR